MKYFHQLRLAISTSLSIGAPCLFATGCGFDSKTVSVNGSVVYQEQPIASGEIIFTPADGQGASVAGKIEQGKYSCTVPTGENIVRVTAYREVPGKFDLSNPGQKNPLIEMYIPPQFNSQSQLRAEVKSDSRQLDFKL